MDPPPVPPELTIHGVAEKLHALELKIAMLRLEAGVDPEL
jgi:hypothetical protein